MEIQLLAVEDLVRHVKAISRALETKIANEDVKTYGVESIKVTYATSKEDAVKRLTEAANRGRPFDILLLDVMIPERNAETGEDPLPPEKEHGIVVLDVVRELKAAHEVLVYSVLEEYRVAVEAFIGGAVDFIPKSVIGPELLARVLAAGAR